MTVISTENQTYKLLRSVSVFSDLDLSTIVLISIENFSFMYVYLFIYKFSAKAHMKCPSIGSERLQQFSFQLVCDAFNFLPWSSVASVPFTYLSNK